MLDDLLNYKFHDMGIGLDYKIILPDYIFNNKVIININTIDGINKKVIINNLFSLSTLEKPNKYYLDSGEEEGDRSREIIIKYDKHKEEPIEFIQ